MADDSFKEFDAFVSDENLNLAWKRLTHSVRREVKDWLGLQAYAPQLDTHIVILQNSLRSEYEPSQAYSFYKTKQDRSLRRFSFLTMDDRLVYQAICNVLIENSHREIFDLSKAGKLFSNIPTPPYEKSPYTFRRPFTSRFGLHQGQYNRYREQVLCSYREFKGAHNDAWLVRTDVRSYFPSIEHSRLQEMLKENKWLGDDQTRVILKRCLAKWQVEPGKGIPIGYECSDQIGNMFLLPLDTALFDFTAHRYVDDVYIFVENFERAKEAIHIVDQVLTRLSLQRNTLKTEFLSLDEFPEEDLLRKLTESLSQLANESPLDETENERQRKLLDLLHTEFGNRFEKLNLKRTVNNISRVAFVLYRLRDQHEQVRRLAFYVLDHYPDYAFHAISYLHRAYGGAPEFQAKLVRMVTAEFEANDLKGIALKYLSILDDGHHSSQLMSDLFVVEDDGDWHLRYFVIRDILDRFYTSSNLDLFPNAVEDSNPFVKSFATSILSAQSDSDKRTELVNGLISCDSNYVKKIGLYLAYRFRVRVDPELVPSALENLVDKKRIQEKADFHSAMKDLFHTSLPNDFPIKKYFGDVSGVNELLSDIRLFVIQGIIPFLDATNRLLNLFFGNWSRLYDTQANEVQGGYPDDDDLTKLIASIEARLDGSYKWKDGKQDYLLGDVRKIMSRYLKEVLVRENMTVRNEIFICYARSNGKWKDRLRIHFKPYENYFDDIKAWSDDKIPKGADWDNEIKAALQRAKVAILLETPDFLASNYIHDEELPEIMRAAEGDGLTIMRFPIISSSAAITPLARINAVWDTSETLQALQDRGDTDRVDRILADACKEVACVVSESFRKLHCNDDG